MRHTLQKTAASGKMLLSSLSKKVKKQKKTKAEPVPADEANRQPVRTVEDEAINTCGPSSSALS
jgi:hypothetical protein